MHLLIVAEWIIANIWYIFRGVLFTTLCSGWNDLENYSWTEDLCKIALHLVSLYEYCPWQSCKTFTGLSIHAIQNDSWGTLLCENLAETDQPPSKMAISKKFNYTNRKSSMSFPMSLRWTLYVAPKPSPPIGDQKHSVRNLNKKLP